FRVSPNLGLATGTQIANQATVTFDTNAPITTQTWVNTIDSSPPASHVLALPATESTPSFQVQWSGTDVGAGIQDYVAYASQDGGPFTAWTETSDMSATFTGVPGSTYAFSTLARDLVGNVEPTKSIGETTTRILPMAVFHGHLALPGRTAPPNAAWQIPLQVT